MRIGEISYTIRLISLFDKEAQHILQSTCKKKQDLNSFIAFDIAKKNEDQFEIEAFKIERGLVSKKKLKKKEKKDYLDILSKSRDSLLYKLKYMSVILFKVGRHTHIAVFYYRNNSLG